MNELDFIVAIILLIGLFRGYRNGLIKEVFNLVILFSSLYLSVRFSQIPVVSLLVLVFASLTLLKFSRYILHKIAGALFLGFVNRIFGSLFGLVKTLILVLCLLSIDRFLPNANIQIDEKIAQAELDDSIFLNQAKSNKNFDNVISLIEVKTQKK